LIPRYHGSVSWFLTWNPPKYVYFVVPSGFFNPGCIALWMTLRRHVSFFPRDPALMLVMCIECCTPTAYNLVPWTKGVMGWSTRGSWHPGRWTAGTYSPQPWKERKLIWTKPPGNYVPAVNLQGSLNYIKLPIFWEIEQCKCIWYSYFLSIVWIGDWN